MAVAPKPADSAVRFLNDDDARRFFDAQARRLLGISGDEFLRRYDAGEFRDVTDEREHRAVMKLTLLSPFGR
jgi:hypothetical protein